MAGMGKARIQPSEEGGNREWFFCGVSGEEKGKHEYGDEAGRPESEEMAVGAGGEKLPSIKG